MSGGLTANGLSIEAIDDIRNGIIQDLRDTFFESMPVGDQDLLGHIVGIISNELGLLWERLEDVNSSQDPDKASGPALDALSILTGTFRQPATSSQATLTLCGTPTTTVAAGSVVQTVSTAINFDTRDDATLVALSAWGATSAYNVGDRVTNSSNCYQCITAGTSAGSGGPTTTDADETDGTVHWEYIGAGTGAVDVFADCEDTGPTVATAGDLTLIQTPVSGWSTALNLTDALLGANEATDEELRITRELELAGGGATTKDALRAAILQLSAVVSCTVFVNNTNATDGDGLTPHSIEALVLGGTDQQIVDAIALNQPAGIDTHGSSSGTHTDSQGISYTVNFSRPDEHNIYVRISVNYDVTQYPSDGDTEVINAILAWGANFTTNKDVDPSAVAAQAFNVAGVLGVTEVLLYTDVIGTPVAWAGTTGYVNTGGAPSVVSNDGGRKYVCITSGTSAGSGGPTGVGTDITDGTVHWRYLGNIETITTRQLALFDSTRITVVSTSVTP